MTDKKLNIVYRPLDKLIPYARNARVHDEAQVAQIAASIKEFGFTNPILLDGDNGVIAGHGRLLAARKLELEQVPCIDLAHLSEPQKRAYILADNKLTLNSRWDDDLLSVELIELQSVDFDLSLTGFELWEIDHLLNGWDSDIEAIESAGEHTDGIEAKVTVRCAQELRAQVADVISAAIHESGIAVIGID